MKEKRGKQGFSLAEALMTLLLVAVTAVISAPVLLKKFEKKAMISHGTYECKLSGSAHVQTTRTREGTIINGPKTGSSCEFVPPPGSKNFQVDICGGTPLSDCRDEDGTHVFMQYPSLPKVKNITIGPDNVSFGKYAYAFKKNDAARIIVVY